MDGKSRRPPFQERAWEPPGQEAWHQVDRNTNRRLANAGKHESGVQRLKVAQIFTTHSAIRAQYLLRCTLSPICLLWALFFFSMGSPQVVGVPKAATTCTLQLRRPQTNQHVDTKYEQKESKHKMSLYWATVGEISPISISSVCLLLAPVSLCLFTQLDDDQWLIFFILIYTDLSSQIAQFCLH